MFVFLFRTVLLGTFEGPSLWGCRAPWADRRSCSGWCPCCWRRTPEGWWAGPAPPPPLLLLPHPLHSSPEIHGMDHEGDLRRRRGLTFLIIILHSDCSRKSRERCTGTQIQCCWSGLLSQILDSIPDHGSNNNKKEKGEKLAVLLFCYFVAINETKFITVLLWNNRTNITNKFEPKQLTKNWVFSTQNVVTKLSETWVGIHDP